MSRYRRRSSAGRRDAGGAQRVQAGPPQRLVGVDVADAGDERLVHEQRLQAGTPPADALAELAQREARVERLRPDAVERVVVGAVEADPAELADVAEAQLAAVVERQRQPLVRVSRQRGGDHEQLAGHLEVDRQEGAPGQVDDELLAAPPDRLDPATRDARREPCRVLVPQRPLPADARAGDHGPGGVVGEQVSAQVARDRLDLGQLGHRPGARPRSPRAPRRPRRARRRGARRASSPPTSRRPSPRP